MAAHRPIGHAAVMIERRYVQVMPRRVSSVGDERLYLHALLALLAVLFVVGIGLTLSTLA
jgi:hypothetical protein